MLCCPNGHVYLYIYIYVYIHIHLYVCICIDMCACMSTCLEEEAQFIISSCPGCRIEVLVASDSACLLCGVQDADLPAYVSSAATLLYAFFVMHQRGHKIKVDPNGPVPRPFACVRCGRCSVRGLAIEEGHGGHDGPSFLAATVENVTVANEQVSECPASARGFLSQAALACLAEVPSEIVGSGLRAEDRVPDQLI